MKIFFNLCISLTEGEFQAIKSLGAELGDCPSGVVTAFAERLIYRSQPAERRIRGSEIRRVRCFSVPSKYKEALVKLSNDYAISMAELLFRELPLPPPDMSVRVSRRGRGKRTPKPPIDSPTCKSRLCSQEKKPRRMLWRYRHADFYCCNCRATVKPLPQTANQ